MSKRYRIGLVAFALLALGASVAALYVHYKLIADPSYSSFCDISATVSCEQVLESQYGRVFGIPVAAGGAIWSGLVLLLAAYGLRTPSKSGASRVAGYIFILATIGLAAVFYFAYTSFFVLKQACPLCLTMYVSVIGTFLLAAAAADSLKELPGHLATDLASLRANPTAATLGAVWIVASIGLIVFFPNQGTLAAQAVETVQQQAETERLTPEQIAEWEQWLDMQPASPELAPSGDVKVLVVKFNDYQCPACRLTYFAYKSIVENYATKYPKAFKYDTRDFPLETECGFAAVHQFACEAAVAVRLAREKGKDGELENWYFANQDSMSKDMVKKGLQQIANVSGDEFDARYASLIPVIKEQASQGQRLGVSGTPTFFINGIQLPSVRPAYFDAAIAWALKKAGATS